MAVSGPAQVLRPSCAPTPHTVLSVASRSFLCHHIFSWVCLPLQALRNRGHWHCAWHAYVGWIKEYIVYSQCSVWVQCKEETKINVFWRKGWTNQEHVVKRLRVSRGAHLGKTDDGWWEERWAEGGGWRPGSVLGSGCISLAAKSQAHAWHRAVGISRTTQVQGVKVSIFLGMYASSLA